MPAVTLTASTRTTVYTFSVERNGGEVGNHPLTGDPLPVDAVVIDAVLRVEEPFTMARPPIRPRDFPTATLRIGSTALRAPMLLQNTGSWPVGAVRRAELSATARAVPADGPVALGIDPPGSGGYSAGALLVVVTYLVMPEALVSAAAGAA